MTPFSRGEVDPWGPGSLPVGFPAGDQLASSEIDAQRIVHRPAPCREDLVQPVSGAVARAHPDCEGVVLLGPVGQSVPKHRGRAVEPDGPVQATIRSLAWLDGFGGEELTIGGCARSGEGRAGQHATRARRQLAHHCSRIGRQGRINREAPGPALIHPGGDRVRRGDTPVVGPGVGWGIGQDGSRTGQRLRSGGDLGELRVAGDLEPVRDAFAGSWEADPLEPRGRSRHDRPREWPHQMEGRRGSVHRRKPCRVGCAVGAGRGVVDERQRGAIGRYHAVGGHRLKAGGVNGRRFRREIGAVDRRQVGHIEIVRARVEGHEERPPVDGCMARTPQFARPHSPPHFEAQAKGVVGRPYLGQAAVLPGANGRLYG